MKSFILKSIIVLMVALVSIDSNAQSVVTVSTAITPQECKELLQEHQTDTLRSRFEVPVLMNDTSTTVVDGVFFINGVTPPMKVLGYSIFISNDSLFRRVDCEKIKTVDETLAAQLYQKWLEMNVSDSLLSGHTRDYVWIAEKEGEATELHDFMYKKYNMKLMGVSSPRDIRYPIWARDKYGWSILADGTWQGCQGRYGWIGDLGFGYDTQNGYWKIEARVGYGRSVYSDNAVHDGDPYWVFRSVLSLALRPVKLDANDLNRLFIIGGIGYERYSTDSKPEEDGSYFRSKGNYLYPHAGIRYERRFPKWGVTFFGSAEWRQYRLVYQHDGGRNTNGLELSLGVSVPIARHTYRTRGR